jgi:nitrogen fixation NifU-like protein
LKNNKPEAINSWITNSFLYTPITDKKTEYFSGKVYNLEVDKAHSYNTTAFTVHNCGDIMRIYINVKKDPKTKKEIITDIKFKTLGCAAAIATSSMITDLAKGKTIDEALKITRADVAKELDGLPPAKMHCSNLAADALHLAIKNYLKKTRRLSYES